MIACSSMHFKGSMLLILTVHLAMMYGGGGSFAVPYCRTFTSFAPAAFPVLPFLFHNRLSVP
jgi:hypothetical protein